MKKISVFIFATLGLASVSFAKPSEQEIKDAITESCGNSQECACIVSNIAPQFPSIEALKKVNSGDFSGQDIKKLNKIIAKVNKQCGSEIKPIVIEKNKK